MCSFCIISASAETTSLQFCPRVLRPEDVTANPRDSAVSSKTVTLPGAGGTALDGSLGLPGPVCV